MSNKGKTTVLIILGVFLLVALVSGATFAFFSAMISSNANAINTVNKKYTVIYSGGADIDGTLNLTTNRDGGLSSTVSLKMEEGSVLPKANVYLMIDNISDNLLSSGNPWQSALKWEVYSYDSSNNLITSASGNFMQCSDNGNLKCENGRKLYLLKNQQLAYTDTKYVVYIWLDAAIADNGVNLATLKGSIKAETDQYTGRVS